MGTNSDTDTDTDTDVEDPIVEGRTGTTIGSSGGYMECLGQDNYNQVTNTSTGIFTALSSEDEYTCGIFTSGNVVCWGRDDYGQTSEVP